MCLELSCDGHSIPVTYLWSPEMVAKPADWGRNVDIVGSAQIYLGPPYKPDERLAAFLAAGM
jgi:hypothetical protein